MAKKVFLRYRMATKLNPEAGVVQVSTLLYLTQLESDDFNSPGGKLEGLGQFMALTMYKAQKYKFVIHVVKTASCSNVLGRAVAVALGLVKRVDEIQGTSGADVGLLKIK